MSSSTFFQNMCMAEDQVNRLAWLNHGQNLLDMNSDGHITLADLWNFFVALIKLPGDLLIYEMQNEARLGRYLHLTCHSYGGVLALLLGLAGWSIWLLIPFAILAVWDWLLRRLASG